MVTQRSLPGADPDDPGRKRRAITHGQKACNPCRLRKVKCSYQFPCQTCIERQHPELCHYDEPLKRVRIAPTSASSNTSASSPMAWMLSRDDWEGLYAKIERLERSVQAMQKKLLPREYSSHDDSAASEEGMEGDSVPQHIHATHSLTGETVFLGGNSVPAMAAALGRSGEYDAARNLLDNSSMPIFTLEDSSTTYPFIDLWGLPHGSPERVQNLCSLLPSHSNCLQYVRQYRDTAHILFPAIIMMQKFEAEVAMFLMARTNQSSDPKGFVFTEDNVYGKSIHWLGLLFACLASGCQCSSMPRRERQLASQVYVCCAYECLRIVNYLSCSQLEDIQNLLVLGNVISNNMNAGVAWSLLGLTIRLAQGLGLHYPLPPETSAEERLLRHDIWARIVWQDSLLSISYDRATLTTAMTRWEVSPLPGVEGFSYAECMLQLCTIALDVVGRRAAPSTAHQEIHRIEKHRQELLNIEQKAQGHLKSSSGCASMRDHLEYWNWVMHRSYVISELCRPMLTKRRHHEESTEHLRVICLEALADTVSAFLNLHNLTSFAGTSWAAVHRSLSSALLLGILKEPSRSPRIRSLVDRFIVVMSSIEYSDNAEAPAPITRSVAALMRLNASDSSDGSSDAGSTVAISEEPSPHEEMQRILWGAREAPHHHRWADISK